jgi:SAM-dependent methyltransferase
MKTVIQYTRFFFYTAFNWSPWLAFFMLYHDLRGAMKYHIQTFSPAKLAHLTVNGADISKSSPYEAVSYFILEKLLTEFRKLSTATSIVDLGCGKGRVMVVAAYFGFTQIKGIDFAKELCEEASRNMEKTALIIPGIHRRVIHADVLDYTISPEDAVFFMFNPFVEETLNSFVDKLEASCKLFSRKTYFLYASPQHALALQKRGYNIVFSTSIMHLEGIILAKD